MYTRTGQLREWIVGSVEAKFLTDFTDKKEEKKKAV